jgi:AcrR family transcriptional regulator
VETNDLARKSDAHRRLLDGMITAVARHGYAEATVAQAVRYGGVARATFYDHFSDKETCVLAAFGQIAERALAGLHDALVATEKCDGGDDIRDLLSALFEAVQREPDAARLLLLEATAGGPRVRIERERLIDDAERAIEQVLEEADGIRLQRLDISAKALLGGVLGVVSIRLLRDESTGQLGSLLDDLLAWITAHSVPSGSPLHTSAAWAELGRDAMPLCQPENRLASRRRLPRGRSKLSTEEVGAEHRQRIVLGVAQVAREKGYAAMTIADIVAAAEISRNVFYTHFGGKDEAFAAAQAMAAQGAMVAAAAAFMNASEWIERVWAGGHAFVEYISGVPDLVYAAALESYAAGPESIALRHEQQLAFAIFIADGYHQRPEAQQLPRLCSEAIANIVAELVRSYAATGREQHLPEMLPELIYILLAPFIGPLAAAAFVENKVRATTQP